MFVKYEPKLHQRRVVVVRWLHWEAWQLYISHCQHVHMIVNRLLDLLSVTSCHSVQQHRIALMTSSPVLDVSRHLRHCRCSRLPVERRCRHSRPMSVSVNRRSFDWHLPSAWPCELRQVVVHLHCTGLLLLLLALCRRHSVGTIEVRGQQNSIELDKTKCQRPNLFASCT